MDNMIWKREVNKFTYPVPVSTSPPAPISRTLLEMSVGLLAAPVKELRLALTTPSPSPGRGFEGIVFIIPASLGMEVPSLAMSKRSPPW
jgi:hypothetical protein